MGCWVRRSLRSLRARVLFPMAASAGLAGGLVSAAPGQGLRNAPFRRTWALGETGAAASLQGPRTQRGRALGAGGHSPGWHFPRPRQHRQREPGPTEAAMAQGTSPPAMLQGSAQLGNHGPRCPVTGPTAGPSLLLRDPLTPCAALTGWADVSSELTAGQAGGAGTGRGEGLGRGGHRAAGGCAEWDIIAEMAANQLDIHWPMYLLPHHCHSQLPPRTQGTPPGLRTHILQSPCVGCQS